MRKRTIGVTVFGIIFILQGLFSFIIPWVAYGKLAPFLAAGRELGFFRNAAYIIFPAFFFNMVMFILIGIGILRLRCWAWYLVVGLAIIKMLGLPVTGLIYGWQYYRFSELAIRLSFIIFVLWVFGRPGIKAQFGTAEARFRIKSWYGALLVVLLSMVAAVPTGVLGYKIYNAVKGRQPFWVSPPEPAARATDQAPLPAEEWERRSFFQLSLPVRRDFVEHESLEPTDMVTLGADKESPPMFIVIEGRPVGEQIVGPLYKILRFENAYQFEEALYASNWAIALLVLRKMKLSYAHQGIAIRRFSTPAVKGFVREIAIGKDKTGRFYGCSVYDHQGKGVGNVILMYRSPDRPPEALEREAYRILSSIQVVETGPESEE